MKGRDKVRRLLIALTAGLCLFGGTALFGTDEPAYRQFGNFSSRDLIWIVAQVKLMFAAFILGVPMFALLIEFIGYWTKDPKWDKLAREFIKLSMIGFSTTAVLGAIMLFMLITFYPNFWNYMSGVFKPTMWIYPVLFFGEAFTLYIYWYGWDWLSGNKKGWHLALGLLLNLFGTALVFLTNAWATFMMTPAGIDMETGVLQSTWAAINNATWHPLNIHRLIANAVFGGAVAGAYAAFKFLVAKTDEDRAYYDWMGYVGNMVAVSIFLILPFAGYWLGKEIYDHNQQMGITLMGGFLSWLWIIQAIMIGILFLSANFYLWVGMERIDGAERYQKYIKYMLFVLFACVLIWSTPHSLVASLAEARKMGGTHHPLLGVMGVMSAKNTAVNLMIITTFLSFALYRRANLAVTLPGDGMGRNGRIFLALFCFYLAMPPAVAMANHYFHMAVPGWIGMGGVLISLAMVVYAAIAVARRGAAETGMPWRRVGMAMQWWTLGISSAYVLVLGVLGYMVDAATRIGFAPKQVGIVLLAVVFFMLLDIPLFKGAKSVGKIRWGQIPARAQYALFLLAVTFCWTMGLMGYARSALRQHWHVYGVMRDTSADAGLPTLGAASIRISLCVVIFVLMTAFIFWLGNLGSIKEGRAALTRAGMGTMAKMTAFVLIVVSGFVIFANSIPQVEHQPPVELNLEVPVWELDHDTAYTLGEEIFFGKGTCGTCHGVGNSGPRAPDLKPTVALAKQRNPDMTPGAYIMESMTDPGAYVVEGYGNIMPAIDKPPISLSPEELFLMTVYLEKVGGGEVTVTKDDMPEAPAGGIAAVAEIKVLGNAERGKDIYFGKGICYTCHMVGGEGGDAGPDLSAIAAINTLEYIQESILEPNKVIAGQYPPIMPAGYGEVINARDFNDLVAYMMTLKGE
ncbi:MAG: cytochrome ubiquinol oxidase subunit I [Acidobacteriota bacterium]|nr:cytochrome ubiquinol oxidase subunit I [Acidobacteriota bacterium]